MITPPLLMGMALLFWGWQTGLWMPAAVMAAMLEGARLTRARWEFSQADLDRIWNLCTVLFFGAAVYALTASEGARALAGLAGERTPSARAEALNRSVRSVFLFFQWMPFCFFPIIAAQAWSQQERMPFSTFSWWLRRQRAKGKSGAAEGGMNLGFAYFGVCLLAASAARARAVWFFPLLCLLLGWALWVKRPRQYRAWAWALSLAGAAGLAFLGQSGLAWLQGAFRELDSVLVARFNRAPVFDPRESRTQFGEVGRLKLSGRIVMHVRPGKGGVPPLLREACYNRFKSTVWISSKHEFDPLVTENDPGKWILLTNQPASHSVSVACFLPGGKGLLPLPQGAVELNDLPVFLLEENPLGVVRSASGPGFVDFRASYDDRHAMDDPPDEDDLDVPLSEQPAVSKVAAQLKLRDKKPEQAMAAISAFFREHFEYSLVLGGLSERTDADPAGRTLIGQFLLTRHKGHCEYFATATTLLLRAAGIPARYAVGYAVQERKGDEYLVRERHAHAWSLAWINGAWQEVDNTPGSWLAIESHRASFLEPIYDLWSGAWFSFSEWRWGQSAVRPYLVFLVGVLFLFAAVRLLLRRQWRRARARDQALAGLPQRAGLDSEFYLVEKRLGKLGYPRQDGESLRAWLRRVETAAADWTRGLDGLVNQHYRLRFDPVRMKPDDRSLLATRVRDWLRRQNRKG